MTKPTALTAALEYASQGYRVFPCRPGEKVPLITEWQNKATTDAEQIATWFEEHPTANVGIATGAESNLIVLDVDTGKVREAAASLAALEAAHGALPPTRIIKTPTGGEHRYFAYPKQAGEYRNSVSKLGEGIDVRADGGYVVAPPSVVGGNRYTTSTHHTVPRLPRPWAKATRRKTSKTKTATTDAYADLSPVEQDRIDRYIKGARAGLRDDLRALADAATTDPADYKGAPWNQTTFDVACRLAELVNAPWSGLTPEVAYKDLFGHAPRDKGFDDDAVAAIWSSAQRKVAGNQIAMPVGADALPLIAIDDDAAPFDDDEDFEAADRRFDGLSESEARELRRALDRRVANDRLRELDQADRRSFADRLLTPAQIAQMPPIEPMITDVLDKGTVALLWGPSGLGKSTLALDFGLCIATGEPWRGKRQARQGRVLYIMGEGAAGIHQRMNAWSASWGVEVPDDAFAVYPMALDLSNSGAVDEAAAVVAARQFDFVLIDTLATAAGGLDENSATAMSQLISAAKRLVADVEAATVLLVHHAGKTGQLRGSSALFAACDTVLAMEGEPSSWTLRVEKRKDGPTGTVGLFKLVPAHDSVIVEGRAQGESEEVNGSKLDQARGLFVSRFSATGATKAEWRDVLTDDGFSRTRAYAAINKLINDGAVLWNGSRLSLPLNPPKKASKKGKN